MIRRILAGILAIIIILVGLSWLLGFSFWSLSSLIVIIFGILVSILAFTKKKAPQPKPPVKEIIREKEIIKEIVMVPCSYCGGLMPQTSTFCPNCGARRKA